MSNILTVQDYDYVKASLKFCEITGLVMSLGIIMR